MSHLIAETLHQDPRIKEAKGLLLAAMRDTSLLINGVKPPSVEKKKHYQDIVTEFSNLRAGKLYYPYLGSGFGRGALVELADGSVKYDFISGIGAHFYGHSNLQLTEALIDAALSDTVMEGNLQQNEDSYYLVKELVEASKLDHCFLSSSGSMATENALKIAFQKRPGSPRILAFENCFMGRTIALSQITDRPHYREGLPTNVFVDYIPFLDPNDEKGSTERTVQRLKEHLSRYPGQHACLCIEPVQGEGGFYPGSKEFFHAFLPIAKKEGIVVISDEVQTFARTPELFASHYFDILPLVDIITIGKASQICATLFKESVKPHPGLLSQTFTSSTAAIRAALFILKDLKERGFYGSEGRIVHIEREFKTRLQALEKKGLLKGPYGLGAMIAFTPFNGDPEKIVNFVQVLFENGLIAFTAGAVPNRVRFLVPAACLQPEDIDGAFKILEETLTQCMS